MAAVTTTLLVAAAAVGAAGAIAEGNAKKNQADANAKIYEAQAKNIETQQKIVAGQYRTRENLLRGQAINNAAKNGVRISGSTANSISQSIMQLQLDNSYEQYNLSVQRNNAYNNAAMQRYQGKQAMISGFTKATSTALNSAVDIGGKYWGWNTKPTANSMSDEEN